MNFILIGIVFFISLCGLLAKAGYPFWYGLIPIYNLALLFIILDIKPILLIILGILLIVLPERTLIATMIYIFMPFLISFAYGHGFFVGLLTLLFPIIMYPLIAFKIGYKWSWLYDFF